MVLEGIPIVERIQKTAESGKTVSAVFVSGSYRRLQSALQRLLDFAAG